MDGKRFPWPEFSDPFPPEEQHVIASALADPTHPTHFRADHASSFTAAGELIVDSLLEETGVGDPDSLGMDEDVMDLGMIFPIAFNFRHAIRLRLHDAAFTAACVLRRPLPTLPTGRPFALLWLWQLVREALLKPKPGADTESFERFEDALREWSAMDTQSYSFLDDRPDLLRHPPPRMTLRAIDLYHFRERARSILTFIYAADMYLARALRERDVAVD